jgi:hypothetical protein
MDTGAQEIPCIYGLIKKKKLLGPIPWQLNPIHSLTPCLLKVQSKIIPPLTSLPFSFSYQNVVCMYNLPYVQPYCIPLPSHPYSSSSPNISCFKILKHKYGM